MDWDNDGDEDYSDGLIEGIFWCSPLWLSAAIFVAWLLWVLISGPAQ